MREATRQAWLPDLLALVCLLHGFGTLILKNEAPKFRVSRLSLVVG